MKTRRHYDRIGGPEEFKRMTVEFANAKGSLKVTAQELGITPQIITRWRRERQGTRAGSRAQVSQEQQEILPLKKESGAPIK